MLCPNPRPPCPPGSAPLRSRAGGGEPLPPDARRTLEHVSEPRGEAGWEGLFWLLFEHSSNPIALLDDERVIVAVNEPALKLWGGRRDELIGTSIAGTIIPSERDIAAVEWQAFMRSGEYSGTRELLRADGSVLKIEFAARLALVGGRRLAIYVAMTRGESQSPVRTLARELPLTEREREVVTLIALGQETPEIAAQLHIAPATVRAHVRNAMSKLGVHTRAQLVAVTLCTEQALHSGCLQT